jgi:hypothetical protein
MQVELVVAFVAGSLSLAGALIMRWFETRAQSTSWEREDRQRFLHEKREAYSAFLAACQWHFANRRGLNTQDHLNLIASQQSVLLLAPKHMVSPAQDLMNSTLKIASATPAAPASRTDEDIWAKQTASFADEARKDLGADD